MTLEGYRGPEWILLSDDASGQSRAAAAEVCRLIFGRTRVDRDGRVRAEAGFIHRPGVVWVGQSVLLLPPRDAEELAARVRRLGVRVALGPVSVSRDTVERFRRPHDPPVEHVRPHLGRASRAAVQHVRPRGTAAEGAGPRSLQSVPND